MDSTDVDMIIDKVVEEYNFDITPQERSEIKSVIAVLSMINAATEKSVTEAVMLVGLQNKYPDIPVWYPFIFIN